MAMSSVEQEDWQTSRTLAECNKYMLEHQIQFDVTFRVGVEGATEDLKAHKYMLISRSPVFYTMFCGSLPQSDKAMIELPDVDPQAFREMLKYLYYEEEDLNIPEYGLLIIYCAKKYMIPKLVEVCTTFLKTNITAENAPLILDQSLAMNETELVNNTLSFICKMAQDVFKLDTYVTLSREAWKMVVQSDKLTVTESQVYDACVKWARAKCADSSLDDNPQNIRQVLGDIVYDIRMPLMSLDEFAVCIKDCDILNQNEMRNMLLHFSKTEPNVIQFQTKPRTGCLKEYYRFIENPTKKDWRVSKGQFDCIDITCSTNVYVSGLLLYGGSDNLAKHTITAKIMSSTGEVLAEVLTTITSDGTGKTHPVKFEAPCYLDKNVLYTLSVEMIGDGHVYYTSSNGQTTVDYEGGKITFSKSKHDNNSTSEAAGQIPGLLLCAI